MANIQTTDRKEWETFEKSFEELKSQRLPHETRWKEIGQFCMRRQEVAPIERDGPLAPRNITDKTAVVQISRLGNLIHGYLFNPFAPFFKGRLPMREPSYSERLWFGDIDRRMHHYLTGPKAPFRVSIGSALYQSAGMGTSPIFTSLKGGSLIAIAASLWDTWMDENPDTGLVDVLYRRFRKKAWRAAQDYPEAEEIAKLAAADPKKLLTFVHATDPNPEGIKGAVRSKKPYVEFTFCLDTKERVGAVGGYDDFPWSSIRFYREAGEVYGKGPGDDVLEWAKMLNALEDNHIQTMEQNNNPTLLDFTNGQVDIRDRRPGAEIPVDSFAFPMLGQRKPLERLYDPVDLRDSYASRDAFRANIKEACFTDWLTPGEGPRQTATEVLDRRDIRLRAMASVVANQERDFNQLGDRIFSLMMRAGLLPPPPESLVGEEIVFDFISPLRLAQNQSEVETMGAYLELVGAAAAINPDAARVPNTEALARAAGRKLGVSEELQNSLEAVAAQRAQEAEAAQRQQALEMAKLAGEGFQAGAQGAANLATAGAQRRAAA